MDESTRLRDRLQAAVHRGRALETPRRLVAVDRHAVAPDRKAGVVAGLFSGEDAQG